MVRLTDGSPYVPKVPGYLVTLNPYHNQSDFSETDMLHVLLASTSFG